MATNQNSEGTAIMHNICCISNCHSKLLWCSYCSGTNDSYDTLHCVGRYACNKEIKMALIRSLYRLLHALRLGGCSTHSCCHTIQSHSNRLWGWSNTTM